MTLPNLQELCQLGAAYFLGEDVPQDYEAAYFWFTLAAYWGAENVNTLRQEIENKLTPEKIAEIQKWAAARSPNQ